MTKNSDGYRSVERREPWTSPAIRTIVPVDRTRGGGGDLNDQDDTFYVS